MIGDLHTTALVGLDGSIDWLCLPHFDSPSCFSRLLGHEDNGFWRLAPAGGPKAILATRRWYRPDALVLETEYDTATGTVRITDCMPVRDSHPHLVRSVEGVSGTVDMHMELDRALRLRTCRPVGDDTRRSDPIHGWPGLGGPVAPGRGDGQGSAHGRRLHRDRARTLSLHPRVVPLPRGPAAAARQLLRRAPHRGVLDRVGPAMLLRGSLPRRGRALADHPQGADLRAHRRHRRRRHHVAARGARRQPQLGLPLLLAARRHADPRGAHARRATTARRWAGATGCCAPWPATSPSSRSCTAPRASGGSTSGRRPGCPATRARPGPHRQRRRRSSTSSTSTARSCRRSTRRPTPRVSRARPPGTCRPSSSTSSRRAGASPTTASGRCVGRGATSPTPRSWPGWPSTAPFARSRSGLTSKGPSTKWRSLRDEISREVCEKGYNADVGAFTQYYGSDQLDASVLMIPLVGFLPADDPRVVSTVEAIERELLDTGSCCATRRPTTALSTG